MKRSRISFCTVGPPSLLKPSCLVVLLLIGSLSSIHAAAISATESTPPRYFPETNTRSAVTASQAKLDELNQTMKGSLEANDMQFSKANATAAVVDSDDDGTSSQNESVEGISQETSTPTTTKTASIESTSASPETSSVTVEVSVTSPSTISSTFLQTVNTVSVTTEIPTSSNTVSATSTSIFSITSPQPTHAIDTSTATAMPVGSETSPKMPSGVVALVTMITFVVIAVAAYVGLIAWRRYLEYRYGNRELLVNDLEFDTNDLRHFEL